MDPSQSFNLPTEPVNACPQEVGLSLGVELSISSKIVNNGDNCGEVLCAAVGAKFLSAIV